MSSPYKENYKTMYKILKISLNMKEIAHKSGAMTYTYQHYYKIIY